jgi:hypothetical protein
MKDNAGVEQELARQVVALLRDLGVLRNGYQPDVHLHRGNRKKRRDAEFEGNWDPDTDSIRISFSPVEEDTESVASAASRSAANFAVAEDRLADLLRALDRAESRPGYEFVSLKWFRDTAMSLEGPGWAADPLARHEALREAIDRRWILTSKVANPRPPNFPVTAIRLNHQMPDVIAVLGNRGGGALSFRPVPIRGEALSATVLRDRR